MESPRFYIFHGSDEFTRSEAVADLRRRMGELGELNTVHLDGRTVTLEELRRACETVPFLADRRLVLVTGLLTRLGRGKERGVLEGVLRLLQALPETTRLVFIEDGPLPDDHPVLKYAAGREEGYVRQFEPPAPEALPGWIQTRARLHGGEMEREAAVHLAQVIGPGDLRLLDGEIAKLVTYAGPGRAVTAQDVAQLVRTSSRRWCLIWWTHWAGVRADRPPSSSTGCWARGKSAGHSGDGRPPVPPHYDGEGPGRAGREPGVHRPATGNSPLRRPESARSERQFHLHPGWNASTGACWTWTWRSKPEI